MHSIQLHNSANQAMESLFRLGVWQHSETKASIREVIVKLFFSIYPFFFPISLMAGAIKSVSFDECIMLIESVLLTLVLSIKILYIIWKKEECVGFLNRICVHSIEDHAKFTSVNDQLNTFMKGAKGFLIIAYVAGFISTVAIPMLGNGRKLFFNIGFPLDYQNSETSFWLATIFIATEGVLMTSAVVFTLFMWYLFLNSGLKYDLLGEQLRNLGVIRTSNKRKISVSDKQKLYLQDLIAGIEGYNQITE